MDIRPEPTLDVDLGMHNEPPLTGLETPALHLFGWALVYEGLPDGKVLRVYPARCRYRGFSEETEIDGFRRLTAHVKENMDVLVEQVEE